MRGVGSYSFQQVEITCLPVSGWEGVGRDGKGWDGRGGGCLGQVLCLGGVEIYQMNIICLRWDDRAEGEEWRGDEGGRSYENMYMFGYISSSEPAGLQILQSCAHH